MGINGDDFNEEDLINDYIDGEYDEAPPPDYEEAYMDEMEEALMQEENQTSQNVSENSPEPDNNNQWPTEGDEELPTIHNKNQNGISDSSMATQEDHFLYGFERRKGQLKWRTATNLVTDQNMMAAQSWKKKMEENNDKLNAKANNSSNNRQPASETQLIKFLKAQDENRRTPPINRCSDIEENRFSVGKKNYHMPSLGESSKPITTSKGEMLYIPNHPNSQLLSQPLSHHVSESKKTTNNHLLEMPMSVLMKKSDILMRKSAKRKEMLKKQHETATRNNDASQTIGADNARNSNQPTRKNSNTRKREHQMWVDKYAPTHFSHLLSDEKHNREVLRALRAWDPYVFKKEPPARPTYFQKLMEKQREENEMDSALKNDESKNKNDKRPNLRERVILLSGPPGVGKTTLAHILAKHAGYRPIEVNASDERSAKVLKDRVIRIMDSATLNVTTSVDTTEELAGRPNCLIMDEIDGADAKASIAALVDIIKEDLPAKGSKKQKPFLRRPIIFICNHKYSPVLRPLLPYARQFDVMPPSPIRLVSRLRAILAQEFLTIIAGSTLLYQLVSGAGGDIRSCLNILQSVSTRARKMIYQKSTAEKASMIDLSPHLTVALSGDSRRGLKDARIEITDTLFTIFQKAKDKSRSKLRKANNYSNKDVLRILNAVDRFGDNSKTLDCMFMNLLTVSYTDPTLDRCLAAHEWLSGSDMYRSNKSSVSVNNSSELHAMQSIHLPCAAAAIHFLCRVETKPQLTFSTRPMADAQYHLEANSRLIQKFLTGLPPNRQSNFPTGCAVIDMVPYSVWLLSPGQGDMSLNRAVSSIEILNSQEKKAFASYVAKLKALGLTYVKSDEITASNTTGLSFSDKEKMRLEPDIKKIVSFKDLKVSYHQTRKEMASALKELLAQGTLIQVMKDRELDSKTAVTNEEVETKGKIRNKIAKISSKISGVKRKGEESKENTKIQKNFLGIGAARARAEKSARTAALVGFNRTKKQKTSHSGSGVPLNQVIRFKYQKGFTQAVRSSCRKEDLLL